MQYVTSNSTLTNCIQTKSTDAKLIYLPPYSPDLNPIEQAFLSIKVWLQWHEAEAL